MSKTTHTPGPWVYGDWLNKKAGFIDSAGWVDIWSYNKGEDSLPFASCKHFNELANARLIAAAPELLDALKDCLAFLERDMPVASSGPERRKASAAIAKATGAAQ